MFFWNLFTDKTIILELIHNHNSYNWTCDAIFLIIMMSGLNRIIGFLINVFIMQCNYIHQNFFNEIVNSFTPFAKWVCACISLSEQCPIHVFHWSSNTPSFDWKEIKEIFSKLLRQKRNRTHSLTDSKAVPKFLYFPIFRHSGSYITSMVL